VKDRCEDEIPLKRTARQAAGRPKREAAPPRPRIPRITHLMALAIKFQEMIDRGEVKDYADLARLGFVTRARVTQIMNEHDATGAGHPGGAIDVQGISLSLAF
jgi:hypothetical protein